MAAVAPGPPPPGPQNPPPGQQGPPPPAYGSPPPAHGYAPPGMAPGMAPAGTTVIIQGGGFREMPVTMQCPYCQATIVTAVSYQIGGLVLLIGFMLFLFGFWICACIPCCIDACKDVHHHCPSCGNTLGVYRRM